LEGAKGIEKKQTNKTSFKVTQLFNNFYNFFLIDLLQDFFFKDKIRSIPSFFFSFCCQRKGQKQTQTQTQKSKKQPFNQRAQLLLL